MNLEQLAEWLDLLATDPNPKAASGFAAAAAACRELIRQRGRRRIHQLRREYFKLECRDRYNALTTPALQLEADTDFCHERTDAALEACG